MGIIIKALREIIDTALYSVVNSKIQNFSCKNTDVEEFLKYKALEYEKRDKSRTYILFDNITLDIVGYYTLSLKTIDFRKDVSKTTIQKIDGFSKNIESVSSVLIGQLGKDSVHGHKISGSDLLAYAINSVYSVQDIVGGRICFLETEDSDKNTKVIQFYLDNHFKILQHDKTDRFLQMFRRL
jgi:hypothetical protein